MSSSKACCDFLDPEYCVGAVYQVLWHQGPEFALLAMKASLKQLERRLGVGSPALAIAHSALVRLAALLDSADGDVANEPPN